MRTLPPTVTGSSSTSTTRFGVSKPARRSRHHATSSAGSALAPSSAIDEGGHGLAPLLVRQPDDRRLLDVRVLEQHRLDPQARDVLPAGLHDVLRAVDHDAQPVRVVGADVARVEPAAAERLAGRRLVLVVAGRDHRRAVDDLAGDADGAAQRVAVLVDHVGGEERVRHADVVLRRRGLAEQLRPLVGPEAAAGDRLGLAEDLAHHELGVTARLEPVDELGRRRGPAVDRHPHRARVERRVGLELVGEVGEHRRGAAPERGDALLVERLGDRRAGRTRGP